MLEWMHPAWLAALPLALLPWAAWLRPHALRFSALGQVSVRRSWRALLAPVLPLLQSLAIAGVVLALARPQEVRRETVRESQGIDILLAIDTSDSMDEGDMRAGPRELTRLQAAKVVMAQFIGERPDDRIGLVVFGEEAFVQVPLTLDHEALTAFVEQLEIGMAGRATAVGSAIAVGTKRMKELDAPSKVLILVTDGRSTADTHVTALQAAEAAAALGVRVYTIGVGSEGRGGLFGSRGAAIDERTLRAVAARTGGRYYRATDTNALADVYAEIDQLEQSTARTNEFVHRDERYLLALTPAMAAFLLQVVLGATVLRRLP